MPIAILLAALVIGAALVASTTIFTTGLVICAVIVAVSLLAATGLACVAAGKIAGWHSHQFDEAVTRRLGSPSPPAHNPRLPEVCSRCADEPVTTRREPVTG